MIPFLRCPLVSIAALTAYLVNIGAGALHHHHGAEHGNACETDLQFQTANPAESDEEEDEDTCLLCKVFHLAQSLTTTFHVEAVAILTGEAFSATAIIRPYSIATTTHARSPPAP